MQETMEVTNVNVDKNAIAVGPQAAGKIGDSLPKRRTKKKGSEIIEVQSSLPDTKPPQQQAPADLAAAIKEAPKALTVDERTQMMIAKDNSELVRIIKIFMAGKALPATLDTEQKVIAAWQMAASLKVPPAIAIQNMAFINGRISIWGELPKALAEATGELAEFRLFLVDDAFQEICMKNKNLRAVPWAAICQIKRANRSVNEYFFSMDDAKKAGLAGKSGPWSNYTAIMLRRRATAMAIKFEFPDALMGLGVAEYDSAEAPDFKDVTPEKIDVADAVNKTLEKKLVDA